MRHTVLETVRALTAAALAISAAPAAAAQITEVCNLARPAEPDSLSSLSYISNGVFWSSTDWQPELYEIRLETSADGTPSGMKLCRKCALEGAKDVEGVAYDPLRGTFWAADEIKCTVCEYDPATGKRLAKMELPEVFKSYRKSYGIESLCIAPGGLEMWIANEEALMCDGPVSTPDDGTVVRIFLFRRTGADCAWSPAGQWAYKTDPIAGAAPLNACRSGVSAICVLEDGTLLALEREYSFKPLPAIRCRIYSIDRSGATDVSGIASLAPGKTGFVPVAKTLLYENSSAAEMYEGIAPGLAGEDGSRLLYLVSDGESMMARRLLVLRYSK